MQQGAASRAGLPAAPLASGGADSALKHLGPQWFAIVMGGCGLALAWHRAEPMFGPAAGTVSALAGVIALLVFVTLIVLSLLRWRRHPGAVADDLRHPVRHAFFAAVPISLMLPERLQPSWFIPVAPPAVIGLVAPAIGFGQGPVFAMIGLGAFSLALALALRIAPRLPRLPFGMPFWAMSFPLAAFAALLLRTAEAEPSLQLAGVALLAVASVVVLWLSLATIRGLRNRSLLQPEPVAAIVPVAST